MKDRILFIGETAPPQRLSDFFAQRSFAVDHALNHEQVWQKIADHYYSIVFCLLDRPDEESIGFIRELRKRIRMPSQIFVNGPNEVRFAMRSVQNGARYYWPSPIDFEEVERYFSDGSFVFETHKLNYQREGTLLQVIKEIALTMELDGLVNILMDSCMELTGADGGAFFLFDDKTNKLIMKAIRGLSGSEHRAEYFGLSEREYDQFLQNRQPVFLHHFTEQLFASNREPVSAIMVGPIWHREEPLGLLVNVKFGTKKQSFSSDDFKLLSLLSEEISAAVSNAITHYKTKELTIKDDLTEAYNRRYFEKYLEEEFMRARRYGANLSLIFFDVDNLKDVNEKHGHLIGSKTLQEVAHRMILTVRGIDKVVRYGGDEFCIVLPETDTQGAFQVADRIRSIMASRPFKITNTIEIQITGSMGIASFPPHASSKEELVRQADKAMFTVKNRTKNAIGVAEPVTR